MRNENRVAWSEGMFLRVQHFQQADRWTERLVRTATHGLAPYPWGISEIGIDRGALAIGQFALSNLRGVLPDGTPFAIPQLDAPPAPLDIAADLKGEIVYLALPLSREGVTEVDFGTEDGSAPADTCRVAATEESVRDHTSASDEPASIQTGRLKLRLLRAKELTDAYAAIGIAQVVERRSDNQVALERSYIAPQVVLDASAHLLSHAKLLHGLIAQRTQALAGRMGQLSGGISELADFLMLQLLNGAEPLFRQHAGSPRVHPYALHADCLRLAGELSTFTSQSRRPQEFPPYRHEDLRATYTPLVDALRRMLTVVLEQNAVQIELIDRSHGVRTAVVPDLELIRSGVLVLAVAAQLPPEQLRTRFVAQTKVGPVDRIRDLVNLQLPGIGLQSLPVAPRQLPFHAGHFYFELDRQTDLWRQFEKSGSLALHIAGDFPGLELALWAIRPT